jgi:lipoprotein-anchoring transpeptidase ErfK/SrfK
MKRLSTCVLFAGLLLPATPSLAAPPPPQETETPLDDQAASPEQLARPEPTEQAIDAADFEGWRERLDARAKAEEERKRDREQERRVDKAERKSAKKSAERGADEPAKAASREKDLDEQPDPFLIRVQILLDRAHASPGVIDGRDGDNLRKAIRAFETMRGLEPDGEMDPEFWSALAADSAKSTLVYEITPEDVNGRYVPELPEDYSKLAKLKWLGYRDAAEMLAERFHMDEKLLRALNPDVDFKTPGQKILVADVGPPPEAKVAKIVVDKDGGELRAYDRDEKLVMATPATVGSSDTPSPSGRMKITGSYPDPHYKYDPVKNFRQGDNRRKLNLPPGPNGPVGSMWIDLSKPTYGIHGTPEPAKIDKTNSHGCVRLTNWDAATLAKMVEPGKTTVEFR